MNRRTFVTLALGAFAGGAVSAVTHGQDIQPADGHGKMSYLPVIMNCAPKSNIELTRIPAYGSTDNLEGRIDPAKASPADFAIVVYICVNGGWWVKPFANAPVTSIRSDGSFVVDITTGGWDVQADRIAIYLIPRQFMPPILLGSPTLPYSLECQSCGWVVVDRHPPGATPTPTPVITPCAAPGIEFTFVPPFGSLQSNVFGRVHCLSTPADYRIALYIYIPELGWWTKPTEATRTVPIQSNGSFIAPFTSGGLDKYAQKIVAVLVPKDFTPPLRLGGFDFPGEVSSYSKAEINRRPDRTLAFAGRTWRVKYTPFVFDPGNKKNYFADGEESAWVDAGGRLHLKIAYIDGHWRCAEIVSLDTFGYGTFIFRLASPIDAIDQNAVLGLFTFDETVPNPYREIDIEFSKWRQAVFDNAQYVIQPYSISGNMHRFNLAGAGATTTHQFTWSSNSIRFSSSRGSLFPPMAGDELQSWIYTGASIPTPGNSRIRLNLWLDEGVAPSNLQPVEVIVASVEYLPL